MSTKTTHVLLWHPEVVGCYKKMLSGSTELLMALCGSNMYDVGSAYGFTYTFELTGAWGVTKQESNPPTVWAEVDLTLEDGTKKVVRADAEWFFFTEEYTNECECQAS